MNEFASRVTSASLTFPPGGGTPSPSGMNADAQCARGDHRHARGPGPQAARAGLVGADRRRLALRLRRRLRPGRIARPQVAVAADRRRRRAARHRALLGRDRAALGGGHHGAAEVPRGRVAILRRLGQRASDHAIERPRHAGRVRRARRRIVQVRQHRRRDRVAQERRSAGERREQHAAERVHVRAGVVRAGVELLRGHVVDGAEEVAGGRQPRVRAGEAREAEVGQVRVVVAEEHVGGLDVAMHEPGGMCRVQRSRHLVDDRGGAGRLEPAGVADQLVQVGPRDPAHHEVQPPVLLAGLVDGDHVRVIDRGRHPRLALEALAEVAVGGVLGGDQLERDRAAQRDLGGAVDDPHPAAAGDRLDPAARDMSALEHVGHPSMLTRMDLSADHGPTSSGLSPSPRSRSRATRASRSTRRRRR